MALLLATSAFNTAYSADAPPYDPAHSAEFKDKLGLFSVVVPEGYKLRDQSTSDRSKVTLRYGNGCQIIMLSSIMRKEWDAKSSMDQKMAALRRGQVVGKTSEITSRLSRLDLAEGYEYTVHKSDQHYLHGFAGVAHGRSFVYVVEVTGRDDAAAVAKPLIDGINTTFRVLARPAGIPGGKTAPLPTAAATDGANWAAAEASIQVNGIVRNEHQSLAMIGGQLVAVGEILRVDYNGRSYPFQLIGIDCDSNQVQVQPLASDPSQPAQPTTAKQKH